MRHSRKPIIIPPTTDMALVFPFDHQNKVFDHSFYSQYLTDGRATTSQITHFLKAAEGAFKKKLKLLKCLKIYIAISMTLSFFCMMFLSVQIFSEVNDDFYVQSNYYTTKGSQSSYNTKSSHTNTHPNTNNYSNNSNSYTKPSYSIEEQLNAVCLGWIALFFACIFWKGVFCLVRKVCYKKARKSVQQVVERYNPLFAPYGLRWNVPLAFPHYIELWKDYKGMSCPQVNVQGPSGYGPQVNVQGPSGYVPAGNNMQMQGQVQVQVPVQKYPVLEPVVEMNNYYEFPGNQGGRAGVNCQGQNGGYMPPQYVNYAGNSHYV